MLSFLLSSFLFFFVADFWFLSISIVIRLLANFRIITVKIFDKERRREERYKKIKKCYLNILRCKLQTHQNKSLFWVLCVYFLLNRLICRTLLWSFTTLFPLYPLIRHFFKTTRAQARSEFKLCQ